MNVGIHFGKRLDFSTCFIVYQIWEQSMKIPDGKLQHVPTNKSEYYRNKTHMLFWERGLFSQRMLYSLPPCRSPTCHAYAHTALHGCTGIIKGCKELLCSAVAARRVVEANFWSCLCCWKHCAFVSLVPSRFWLKLCPDVKDYFLCYVVLFSQCF